MAVAAWTFLNHQVSEWVQVLAALWLLIQMAWFLYSKLIRKDDNERDRQEGD